MPDSFERISQDLNAELKVEMMQKSLSYNQNVKLPFKDIKEKFNRSISAVRPRQDSRFGASSPTNTAIESLRRI